MFNVGLSPQPGRLTREDPLFSHDREISALQHKSEVWAQSQMYSYALQSLNGHW